MRKEGGLSSHQTARRKRRYWSSSTAPFARVLGGIGRWVFMRWHRRAHVERIVGLRQPEREREALRLRGGRIRPFVALGNLHRFVSASLREGCRVVYLFCSY